MKASEPVTAYNTPSLQGLKDKLMTSIAPTNDEQKLQECLYLLHSDEIPCVFTDEEFGEELRLSEASGIASEEEMEKMFAKWEHS